MASISRYLLALIAIIAVSGIASAQVQTGTPPFGSLDSGPDVINLANLNSHITIPVLRRAGRGTDFTYLLSYDSSVWYPVGASGSQTWQPVGNFGWTAQGTGTVGYVAVHVIMSVCGFPPWGASSTNTNWVYYDQWGTAHAFSGSTTTGSNGCGSISSLTTTATDGSGYTLNATSATATSIIAPTGEILVPPTCPYGGGLVGISCSATPGPIRTDRNGNQISLSSGVFTDTLGTTVLTAAGTAPNPVTYSYTSPSGATAAYTVKYTSYSVQTAFGCSGIAEYGPTSNNLVSEIDLPDNSKYTFAYEPTPGIAGKVTGRLASVTLPTGGTISYVYTGGSSGHITCLDGSAAILTRQTPDGIWTYSRTLGSGVASTTQVHDPQGNWVTINFQGIFETKRVYLQNTGSQNITLRTVNTCYNGSASPCTGTAISLPILRRTQIIQIPDSAGIWAKYDTYYNSYGLQTEEDVYDFGSGAPQTTPLKKTVATYASLGNGIVDKPASLTVKDGAGNTKAQTTFTYDEGTLATTSGTPQHVAISGSRGNATTVKSLVQGTTFLTKTLSYFDTGDVQTVTDVNGAQTTYNYASAAASCGNSFPTSVTLPLSLTKSATWNCTGGVAIQFTDENGNNTTPTYTDAFFWRPASVTDPTSAVLNFSYPSSPSFNTAESTLTFNSSNSAVDVLMTYDGLGRKHVQQKRQSPGLSNFDSVEVDYDSLGRPSRITPPYSATSAGQTNPSPAPATTTTYDALGRVLTVTDAGTGSASYTYTKNDVLVVVGPAPAGENLKKRQMEYDALGRLTSVCEITSATGSGACGQTVSQTGFWTKYSYDVLGNLTGVTQNAQAAAGSQQTRGYSYDSLSRPISVTTPEAGTVNNTYDTDATCGTSSGDLVKSADAVGNVSCYAHDALHRVTSVTYSSGPYAASMPNKYFVYDAANIATTPTATTMVNAKARLAEAYTCFSPCTTKVTDAGFSYSARGEVTDAYQSTPHSGGYYHLTQSYWAHGAPYQLSGLPGLPTISYGGAIGATSGLDGEGRFTQVTASTGQNPVTSTTYNVLAQPTQITFGSLDADTFGYDPNTGRMNQYQFSVNSQLDSGLLTWNANGTLQQLSISNAFNAADSQICTYVHDDLIRLTSANCGTAAGQTFSYDPLGNINKSGSPYSFLATYSSTTNRMTCIGGSDANCAGGFVPSYDNNGNVLNDSFHSYTWDINARPVTIDSVSMTYDALGRMVEQNRSGVYTQIVYAPAGAKLALMNGQTLQKAFVPLTGGATAVYTASGLSYYRHSDWLGSSRLASTPARTVYSTTAYAPFGEPYAQSGTADLSFTGQNQDTVGGSYDFLAREYAIQGRWPSPDPMGGDIGNPQSLNGYAYVLNSPLNLVDPLGLCGGPPGIVTHSINGVPQGPGTIFTSDPCPGIWGWNFTFYTPNNRMSMFLAKHTKAFQKKLSLKRIIRRTNLVLREIGNYMPVPCGGGGFLYGGGRVSGGVASVGLYRIESFDTRTGHSGGPFTDITVGEGVQGGYGYATYSGGESEHFLFGGIGADVGIASAGVSLYGSHVEGDSILHNQIGINGDLGVGLPFLGVGAGLGLGINTDSLTSCYDNNFH